VIAKLGQLHPLDVRQQPVNGSVQVSYVLQDGNKISKLSDLNTLAPIVLWVSETRIDVQKANAPILHVIQRGNSFLVQQKSLAVSPVDQSHGLFAGVKSSVDASDKALRYWALKETRESPPWRPEHLRLCHQQLPSASQFSLAIRQLDLPLFSVLDAFLVGIGHRSNADHPSSGSSKPIRAAAKVFFDEEATRCPKNQAPQYKYKNCACHSQNSGSGEVPFTFGHRTHSDSLPVNFVWAILA
jgi:hypothetical protein